MRKRARTDLIVAPRRNRQANSFHSSRGSCAVENLYLLLCRRSDNVDKAGTRRYEWYGSTVNVCAQSFERRSALCFQNEYSDVVWIWGKKTLL
jgi:hypothetical protein